MYPVSNDFLNKIKELDSDFKIKIQIQHSTGTLDLEEEDIIGGTFTFSESSQSGEEFTVGSVVAGDIGFQILRKLEYENISFEGAKVIPQVGLLIRNEIDTETYFMNAPQPSEFEMDGAAVWEYVPIGKFTTDDPEKFRNVIKIKALDNAAELDKSYSLSTLSYPASLYQIYVDACNMCDIPVGSTTFPNKDYIVQNRPVGDYTFRDIIGFVAQLAGCFAKCNRFGALEIRWYSNTNLTLNAMNRFDFIPKDYSVQIKGVSVTVDDTKYLVGSDEYEIDLSDNPLFQGDYNSVLNNIFNNIKDTVFVPYESKWQGNPAVEAGDIITQIDKDGNEINTLVTTSIFRYRGASTISAKGLPARARGYKGSTNKKIANIIRKEVKPIANQLTNLQQAQLNATELIANMLGGYAHYEADGFYISDNPVLANSTKVWKWGLGGFGYSENGVDGPYETSITADGSIVAMLVAANIVTANMIQAGILQSEDGSVKIDLDNNSFNFKNVLKWDGTAIQMLDNLNNERMRLGNYASGKYGLLLKDSSGNKTILDEDGILQTWQEGRADNVASGKPLILNVYLPENTKSINQAILRFKRQPFRAYSTAAASGGGINKTSGASSATTTSSGGGATKTTTSGGGTTKSTSSGGSSTPTTSSGGGSSPTTSNGGTHRHRMFADYGSGHVTSPDTRTFYAYNYNGSSIAYLNVEVKNYLGQGLWTVDASDAHSHSVSIPSHTHSVTIPAHTHDVTIPDHSHSVDIPAHTHGMDHNHNVEIPDHTHGITYGIYEGTMPTTITVKINGVDRTSTLGGGSGFNTDQSSLNITSYLVKGQWNTIELGSSALGRIDATVFIQALMGVS